MTGPDSRPWFEDDELWRAVGFLFTDEAWEAAAVDAGHLVALLSLEEGSRVLDLGCGPGRYALPLAGMGVEVTGVDRTAHFLDEAARRAEMADLQLDLVRSDMREFRRPEAFDAAISMLTSFGYFEDPEDDLGVLRNVLDSLRPGGTLVIDTIGKEVLGRIYQARDWKAVGEEVLLFDRRPVRAWSWMENTWIHIRDGQRREFHFGHRLYSGTELVRLTLDAGFGDATAHGGLEGAPYDETSDRLVVVARKES